jgi:hypothetical protein
MGTRWWMVSFTLWPPEPRYSLYKTLGGSQSSSVTLLPYRTIPVFAENLNFDGDNRNVTPYSLVDH